MAGSRPREVRRSSSRLRPPQPRSPPRSRSRTDRRQCRSSPTRWTESGPTTLEDLVECEPARHGVLGELVARDRGERDRRERQPLCPRRGERTRHATRSASRPSVAEPTRTSSRRSRLVHPALGSSLVSRCRAKPTGSPRSRSRGIVVAAAARRCRTCRSSIRCKRGVDLGEDLLGVLTRACSRSRGRGSRWRSRRGGCRSSRRPPRPLRRGSRDARRGATRAHARRRCRSSRSASRKCSVSMLTAVLSLPGVACSRSESPLDQRRPDPRQLHDLVPAAVARNERQGRRAGARASRRAGGATASLARPRSGAAVTRTFQASPCRPTTAVRPGSRANAQAQSSRLRGHALSLRRATPRQRSRRARRTSCAPRSRPHLRRRLPPAPAPRPARRAPNAESASSSCSRSRRESVLEALVLGPGVAMDCARLCVGLGHDEVRLAAGAFAHLRGRALGGDERLGQQRLELPVADEVRVELLHPVRELAAVAPHVLEARCDLLEQPVDPAVVAERRRATEVMTCLISTGVSAIGLSLLVELIQERDHAAGDDEGERARSSV